VSAADSLTVQQDMRKALLYMAGDKGKKTPAEIMKEIAAGEEKDRVNGVKSTYESKVEGFNNERAQILEKKRQSKVVATRVEHGAKHITLKQKRNLKKNDKKEKRVKLN
jgi:hypothetical protein